MVGRLAQARRRSDADLQLVPEILAEEIKAVRDDALIATGRSDYPNQINNVAKVEMRRRLKLIGAMLLNHDPTAAQLAEITVLAAEEMRRLDATKVAPRHSSISAQAAWAWAWAL